MQLAVLIFFFMILLFTFFFLFSFSGVVFITFLWLFFSSSPSSSSSSSSCSWCVFISAVSCPFHGVRLDRPCSCMICICASKQDVCVRDPSMTDPPPLPREQPMFPACRAELFCPSCVSYFLFSIFIWISFFLMPLYDFSCPLGFPLVGVSDRQIPPSANWRPLFARRC